jgi:hypothetical protein
MISNKSIMYGGAAIILVIGCALFPMAYYYYKLPSTDAINSGASLNSLLSGFGKEFSSSLASGDVKEVMLCLSCLPHTSSSKECSENMSSFVAKNLITESSSMLSWHINNAYLAKAVSIKYESAELRLIYFAMLVNIFRERNLDSLCQSQFRKSCAQLEGFELRTLQRAFLSGKMPPPDTPADEVFAACFSKRAF